jgi:hypothetical protein
VVVYGMEAAQSDNTCRVLCGVIQISPRHALKYVDLKEKHRSGYPAAPVELSTLSSLVPSIAEAMPRTEGTSTLASRQVVNICQLTWSRAGGAPRGCMKGHKGEKNLKFHRRLQWYRLGHNCRSNAEAQEIERNMRTRWR